MSKGSLYDPLKTLEPNSVIEQAGGTSISWDWQIDDLAHNVLKQGGFRRSALPSLSRLEV